MLRTSKKSAGSMCSKQKTRASKTDGYTSRSNESSKICLAPKMAVSPHSSIAVLEVRRNIKKIQTSNTLKQEASKCMWRK